MARHVPNLIELAMKHRSIPIIITSLLVLFGGYALWTMPRDEFPRFTIRQGLIVGVYPGATSQQVEEQLTRKVEGFLFGFQEVDRAKTTSISQEGMMFFNDERMTMEELGAALAQAAFDQPDASLVIEADGRVPHRTLVQIYNMATAAGIKSVVLATRVPAVNRAVP